MEFARKNIRLASENYSGKRAYFVTICCQDRRPALGDAETVSFLLQNLRELGTQHGFAIHAYCFMPDHMHLLVEGVTPGSCLLDFVNRFKQQTAFQHRNRSGGRLWQFKFYDHILRRDDAAEDVAWYIWMNPVRKGLCREPREFPFSGSFMLPWRSKKSGNSSWTPPWKRASRNDLPG